jgi:8-oxo-dGTP pyrophosphatase MutT (NUDIX family)
MLKMLMDYGKKYKNETIEMEFIFSLLGKPALPQIARTSFPAHITASGILIQNGQVLLIWHPVLQKWLQPGGHLEQTESPLEAALRETKEETGYTCSVHPWHCDTSSTLLPIDIDCHKIPENKKKHEPEHWHIDCRYILQVGDLGLRTQAELDNRFIPIHELSKCSPSLKRLESKISEIDIFCA